jgi:hypothetical protein
MSNIETSLKETRIGQRGTGTGRPASIAFPPTPADFVDDVALDLDADVLIEAREILWLR